MSEDKNNNGGVVSEKTLENIPEKPLKDKFLGLQTFSKHGAISKTPTPPDKKPNKEE